MADISVNGINLGSSPVVNLEDEFFRTGDGEIIGGVHKISINGSIVEINGNLIMAKLKSIRELGNDAKCISIKTGVYNGQAKVENVTISQGPDPAWINQGEFSIELTAPLTTIPGNRFGFVAGDNVREFSRSESVSLGDDSHGYAFSLESLQLSKTFVTYSTKMSIRTHQPFCDSKGTLAMDLLQKLVYGGPTDPSLAEYARWKIYLKSRSLDISGDGSISFSYDAILMDPTSAPLAAFVDLSFSTSDSYAPREETHTISGNIEGLSSISWKDLIILSDTCSSSKLGNAQGVYGSMSAILSDYDRAFLPNYLPMELILQANCPVKTPGQVKCNETIPIGIKRPASSSVATNRITGIIGFTFIWSSSTQCEGEDGSTETATIDVTPTILQFVQHVIPRYGTIVQKLGSYKNERVTFNYAKEYPLGLVGLPPGCHKTIDEMINKYFQDNPFHKYLNIEWTRNYTLTSFTEKKSYIAICQTRREDPVLNPVLPVI